MNLSLKCLIDLAAIVAIILAAKTAIAEPYYVPSGSMEPTLQIGDELLATKYPYGYSAASLPVFVTLPETERVLGALPKRGDVVVFRWPGDLSQIWVKRVVGLPGDRIAMHQGRLWINRPPGRSQGGRCGQSRSRGWLAAAGGALHRDAAGRSRTHHLQARHLRHVRRDARDHHPAGQTLCHGRQPRQLRRQPRSARRRRRRAVAGFR